MALRAWLDAFLFTQAIEVPIYVFLARIEGRGRFLRAFGASLLTHPIVWFVIPRFWPWGLIAADYLLYGVAAEAFAIAVEAVYMRRFGIPRPMLSRDGPLVWSLVANGASCGLGLVSRWLVGWP